MATEPRRGQAYLVGETLALRPLALADAANPAAWRPHPFPVPAVRAEELLRKEVPAANEERTQVLVAERRADGALLGAVHIDFSYPVTAEVEFLVPETHGPAADVIAAEMLGLVVPWVSGELAVPSVWVEIPACWPETVATAGRVGMRPGARLRDAVWRGGRRHDQLGFEMLHPVWLERMGDPGVGIDSEEPPATEVPVPAPLAWRPEGPVPEGSLLVGDRLALRPLQASDADRIAHSFLEEQETFFLRGRRPVSPILVADWIGKMGEAEVPTNIELAVVLREGGDLIGEVNLMLVDWVARTAETAAWIYRAEHRGGGLGTEAKHLLLEYAFERLGLHMVRSYVFDSNQRSAAAVVKQGYRRAGRQCWALDQHAGFIGWQVFDLLAEEWRSARR